MSTSLGELQHQGEHDHACACVHAHNPCPHLCPCSCPSPPPCLCLPQSSLKEAGGQQPLAHLSIRCGSPCPHRRHASAAPWHTRGGPAWWPGAGECVLGGPAAQCRPARKERGPDITEVARPCSPVLSHRPAAPRHRKQPTFESIWESIPTPDLPQERHLKSLSLLPLPDPWRACESTLVASSTQHTSSQPGWAAPTRRAQSRGTARQ